MRNIATKVDNGIDTLEADDFNASQDELENAVTSSGQTLDPAGGPNTSLYMLAMAMAAYSSGGGSIYTDAGTANAHALSSLGSFQTVPAYFNGMMIIYAAANTNTGSVTVNVNLLGAKDLTDQSGNALIAGKITAGNWVIAIYSSANDRFEIPNQLAPFCDGFAKNYTDSGTANTYVLSSIRSNNNGSYYDGMIIMFNPTNDNTGASTVNIDSLGAKNIEIEGGGALVAGIIISGKQITAKFNSTDDRFEIINGNMPIKLIASEIYAASAGGGGSAVAGYNTRILNTAELNRIPGASLNTGTGVITLPAGKYRVIATSTVYCVTHNRMEVYDNTGSAILVYGTSVESGAYASSSSVAYDEFELSVESEIIMRHYCKLAYSTVGLGPDSDVDNNIYAHIELEKL